jgi:hypothetical protein
MIKNYSMLAARLENLNMIKLTTVACFTREKEDQFSNDRINKPNDGHRAHDAR